MDHNCKSHIVSEERKKGYLCGILSFICDIFVYFVCISESFSRSTRDLQSISRDLAHIPEGTEESQRGRDPG